ncbi:hypothetical protein MKX03_010425 [Papaver bracteatum]|nr:hypothetical protein MKX03_010425 [Papaver bracteatum]
MIRNDTVDDPSSSLPSLGNGNGSEQFKYKGARKRKWGKWVAEIRLPNSRERIWLGSHDTPKKAARAFDAALFCLRGQGAKFNFPDNPPNIQGASSLSRAEIQEVSARYANEEDEQQHNEEENINRLETSNNNIDNGTADWDFLDLLWASRGVGDTSSPVNNESDFGVYSGVNDFPGEFLPLTPQQEVGGGDYGDENYGGVFHHHSNLWNF